MDPPLTPRAIISGIAKMPSTAATTLTPSQSQSWPKVKRSEPVCGSSPTRDTNSPRNPTETPLIRLRPESIAMKVIPNSARRKNSAGEKARMTGLRTGSMAARNSAPITPPTPDAPRDAPSARPASPRCAIGNPSTMVAASGPVPGTPKRIEGTDPPVCTTACMAKRKIDPARGSMPKTNGISSTMPSFPPSPGTAPKNIPSGIARRIRPIRWGEVTIARSGANITSRPVMHSSRQRGLSGS